MTKPGRVFIFEVFLLLYEKKITETICNIPKVVVTKSGLLLILMNSYLASYSTDSNDRFVLVFYNNIFTTIFLQQYFYNNIFTTIFLQQYFYNNIFTTIFLQQYFLPQYFLPQY